MGHQRTHIVLPEGLVAEIDALVGRRRRSAFLAEVAAREVRRRRLLAILDKETPIWDPGDHPEIERAGGSAGWVRKSRRESDRASQRRSRKRRG